MGLPFGEAPCWAGQNEQVGPFRLHSRELDPGLLQTWLPTVATWADLSFLCSGMSFSWSPCPEPLGEKARLQRGSGEGVGCLGLELGSCQI